MLSSSLIILEHSNLETEIAYNRKGELMIGIGVDRRNVGLGSESEDEYQRGIKGIMLYYFGGSLPARLSIGLPHN